MGRNRSENSIGSESERNGNENGIMGKKGIAAKAKLELERNLNRSEMES
ncbi:MAG: hypothetical protein WC602_01545 [archaeon]